MSVISFTMKDFYLKGTGGGRLGVSSVISFSLPFGPKQFRLAHSLINKCVYKKSNNLKVTSRVPVMTVLGRYRPPWPSEGGRVELLVVFMGRWQMWSFQWGVCLGMNGLSQILTKLQELYQVWSKFHWKWSMAQGSMFGESSWIKFSKRYEM